MFSSQFDKARRYAEAYAGPSGETRFWTPAKVAAAGIAGAAAAGLVAAGLADDPFADDPFAEGPVAEGQVADGAGPPAADDGGAWSVHSDWTDASVGGDGEGFMYFSDGDVSFTVDG
ncbi:hypothetical protein [Nonomuraea soli]|uniref:Uncharacterized protein n=1 Tax=Nonomuraea soli TaxID=1032476 RepID=A0A7W0CMB4_9ACTN|nr:hypothetical protein [Nonomuraea soli]MBA2893760.1 hypothetical protein [Nonomuraea soli]